MSKSFHRALLGISVAVILVVFLGGFGPAGIDAAQSTEAYKQMGVYEDVLHKIQADYVTQPNMDDVTNGALHGLLESLDADSSYLTKSEYAAYLAHEHEPHAQIGIDVSRRFGYGSIVSVVPGSPAQKANIQDGDLIVAVDGKSTLNMSLAMIRLDLDGAPGSLTDFDLVRPGNPKPDHIAIARADVQCPPVNVQQKDSGILYLQPYALTADRVDQILARLRSMKKNKESKVILDLRGVATGPEDQGIRLANAFLKSGTIAMLSGQTVPTQTFTAEPSQFVTAAPLVVLVNNGTAGAAEIVAGAVLGNKRGDVVGTRTFGEGGEMKTFPLPDGAALLLTVAKYETPDGSRIEDKAITPNVQVSENPTAFLPGTQPSGQKPADDQLNKAISILNAKAA